MAMLAPERRQTITRRSHGHQAESHDSGRA